jgi:hypothetical protein
METEIYINQSGFGKVGELVFAKALSITPSSIQKKGRPRWPCRLVNIAQVRPRMTARPVHLKESGREYAKPALETARLTIPTGRKPARIVVEAPVTTAGHAAHQAWEKHCAKFVRERDSRFPPDTAT